MERILKCYYNSHKYLKIIFDPRFAISGTTLLRIWSSGGNVLFTKSEQTLTQNQAP
jgi:hypothetical protein